MSVLTWARYHPEVAEVSKSIQPWPCEKIDTGLTRVEQPNMVMGPGQELFVRGGRGEVFHSQDGGKSWALLAWAMPFNNPPVPKSLKMKHVVTSGIGVTGKGTLLMVWRLWCNDGRDYCGYEDDTSHSVVWIARSEDRG